jgi:hypothetical protein
MTGGVSRLIETIYLRIGPVSWIILSSDRSFSGRLSQSLLLNAAASVLPSVTQNASFFASPAKR